MRILLAKDEKALSGALLAILKHNNYSVDAVYDGQAALKYTAVFLIQKKRTGKFLFSFFGEPI